MESSNNVSRCIGNDSPSVNTLVMMFCTLGRAVVDADGANRKNRLVASVRKRSSKLRTMHVCKKYQARFQAASRCSAHALCVVMPRSENSRCMMAVVRTESRAAASMRRARKPKGEQTPLVHSVLDGFLAEIAPVVESVTQRRLESGLVLFAHVHGAQLRRAFPDRRDQPASLRFAPSASTTALPSVAKHHHQGVHRRAVVADATGYIV